MVVATITGSVCLSERDVHCVETVQDKPMVCMEVEREYGIDIAIYSIFDPPPHYVHPAHKMGVEFGVRA